MGVGLTLAGLVVAVYYGKPMMRLAIWTAKNDFREACKSELEAALPQTLACKEALDQPPQPPIIRKRGVAVVRRHSDWRLQVAELATCCMLLMLLFKMMQSLMRWSRTDLEQVKRPVASSTAAHHFSERDALIRLLFDTAQRLEAEGDKWELPAELKVELITMLEQSGPQTTTGPPASGLSQQIETRESSPSRGASGMGAEAATTVIKKSEVPTSAQNTAVNVLETIKNRSQYVPVLPPLPSSYEFEATPTSDSSTASALLLRPDDGQTTLNNSKIECNMFLPALSNLLQVIRSTTDDFLGVEGAKFLLRRVGIPIALSFSLFLCSNVYTEGRFHHWSGMNQWWGSIWKAVRILLSFVAIFESLLLDFTTESQQRLVNISLEMLAILVGLGVITLDALSVRFGQDVGKMDLSKFFFITFLICTLLFDAICVMLLAPSIVWMKPVQLCLALPISYAVLTVFLTEFG